MKSHQGQTLGSIDNDTIVLPAQEIDYDKLSRADLLRELRALRVVLVHMQGLLDADRTRDAAFRNLEVAYRAALDACARAEAKNLELQK